MQSPVSWCIEVGHCRVADISPEQGRTPPVLVQTSQPLCPTLQQSSAVVPQRKGHALEEEGRKERGGGRGERWGEGGGEERGGGERGEEREEGGEEGDGGEGGEEGEEGEG